MQNIPDNNVKINYPDGIKYVPCRCDMEKIYLELTTRCNFDCITCIRNSWSDKTGDMENKVLNAVLEELPSLPELETVQLGGFGEPQIHPRFLETVARIKDIELKLEFITNGHFLTPETIDRLLELEVDRIIVSVDAPTEEEFEEIRKNSNFNRLQQNLYYLQEKKQKDRLEKPRLTFEFVAMKKNYKLLPNLTRLAEKLGVESLLVTNLLPYTRDMVDQTLYDGEKANFTAQSKGSFLYLNTSFPAMELKTGRKCNFITRNSLSISREGRVTPCYPLLHNYTCYIFGRKKEINSHSFGTIPEESIADIWAKEEYVRFRHRVRHEEFPSCPDCDYRDGCGMSVNNRLDCWGQSPSCADCLWYRELIVCP